MRWGFIGLGEMAETFATDLRALGDDAEVVAVASSTLSRARAFADAFGATAAYDDPAALVRDERVDVVYVATTHDRHAASARLALEAGRPVLVEKPLAPAAAEVEEVLALARQRGVLAMEAMWTLCLPVYAQVRAWLSEGAIGEPRQVVARFGFRSVPGDSASRLRDPASGGGAILDVGVYPVALAQLVFGDEPEAIAALGHVVGGVDEGVGAVLRFPGGGLALIGGAIEVETDYTATIDGSEGRIVLPGFWRATTARLERGDAVEEVELPCRGRGWASQAQHVQELVAAGAVESPLVTHAGSVARARICDAIRREIGTMSAERT